MNILVINAGSSSLKYQLFDMDNGSVPARGLLERIGLDGRVKHKAEGHADYEAEISLPDHASAVRELLGLLTHAEHGVLENVADISAVGHRVVHGGEHFSSSALVTRDVETAIESVAPLAPLHNPPNLVGISACREVMGDIPQVAVFDTAFHQTIPEHAFLYALPYEYYTDNQVRRYGFHGTSHRYVSERAAKLLDRPLSSLKIVTCHLGNGSSLAAVDGGRSVDTTMGMTPLEGVPMGTRSGNIDPAIIEYICSARGMTVEEVITVLNKKSGMLGISGVSSDFRDLYTAAAGDGENSRRSMLALDIFAYNVRKQIGALAAAMGGIDALVFTAGVGENNPDMRAAICGGLGFLGLALDGAKNAAARGESDISADGARAGVLVIPTNEEYVIAMDTRDLI